MQTTTYTKQHSAHPATDSAAAIAATRHAAVWLGGMLVTALLEVRNRVREVKDKVFYEFAWLLFSPCPLLLVLLWPGWILVGGLWVWWYWQ